MTFLIIYVIGVIIAMWTSGLLIKKHEQNGEEVESGMVGCVCCLSWIAVIILLTRYKKQF
jgi:hypothetical protein